LGLEVPLGLDVPLGLEVPSGLDLDALWVTRRNKQPREMEDTVMDSGSTYLSVWVRLNHVLNLLGRFLELSTASNFVAGL
jgi:hypothetical protein